MPPDARLPPWLSRLYPILDASFEELRSPAKAIRSLAGAGCRLVQLRAKNLSSRAYFEWAQEAVHSAEGLGLRVLVNDRVDVALAVGAAGVHLGQDDLSVAAARRILGRGALIGLSTHSVDQAREANRESVDYVAIGPVFPTRSKRSDVAPLGPEGVRRLRRAVTKPLVAIGGITIGNGRDILEAGADSLAVISALMEEGNLEEAARKMMGSW